MDPRIHFALVCGAKSCPPIKVYTPTTLQEGLDSATSAFCEGVQMHLACQLQGLLPLWEEGGGGLLLCSWALSEMMGMSWART